MNIIVRPYGRDLCYCRPDTTWERENKDFYVPDGVESLEWAPIIFVRISKAGKCIGRKFASRYHDAFNFGVLLYGITAEETAERAFSSCMDHTSLLPFPLYNTVVMETEGNVCKIFRNDVEIFSVPSSGLLETVENAICSASRFTSLRIGDFVAVELAPLSTLVSDDEGSASLKASFCENNLYDIKILF